MAASTSETGDLQLEGWACDKAQEIMLREGFLLIRSARSGSNTEIRETTLLMARAIAASLVEASAVHRHPAAE
ncbi:hypothetical protein AB3G45_21635 [Shinella sp. S4-D37]|uniref:hypothetical protein n=1 Tax=Shinella sp. S4-D37 TaxID=3161999 RepID=UPI0034669E1C